MENFNINDLLSQAQAMQSQMQAAQEKLGSATVTGTAGGGMVTVTMTGAGELTGVEIKPEACDPEDTETLADLIVAAVRDGAEKAANLQSAFMPAMPGMPDLPGLS